MDAQPLTSKAGSLNARTQKGLILRESPLRRAVLPLTLLGGTVLLVEIIVRVLQVSSYLLPAPSVVLVRLVSEWRNITSHLLVTTTEAVGGFTVAAVLAILAAVAFVRFEAVERAFFPLAIILQTIPVIIIAPILVVLLGNGLGPKIVIAAMITFFPTLVNMTRGLKAIDPLTLDLFATLNASWLQVLWKLRFPGALPYLFSSLKIASANCFIGAIVAEWMGADCGIGYLAQVYLYQLNIDLLYAAVLASSATAILFSGAISLAEMLACPWQAIGVKEA